MKHIRQLDALRGIAVIMVIISHWIPKFNILPWGEIGVDIFFVLSGFLISGILLEKKDLLEKHEVGLGRIIKNFFVRRTLRIFPIYYLMILVHYLFANSTGTSVRENVLYYLSYTSNYLFFHTGHLDGIASHFWSLAVEEQFYLLWPWIILLVKEKHLRQVFWGFVVIGFIFPILVSGDSDLLTPACFDAFAIGALLAYMNKRNVGLGRAENAVINLFTVLSLISLISYPLTSQTVFAFMHIRLPVSIVSFWLIRYSLYQRDIGSINWILDNKLIVFIGKVSYGVYIYHTIIPWIWSVCYTALLQAGFDFHSLYFFPEGFNNGVDLVFKMVLLIFVSWVSWVVLENPINRLKRNFNDDLESKVPRRV